ncbi:MAG: methionyl-tRNA formyltransferase [Firmicutes bacterium]|nr:methionyl-tRNA formyltransferase [Bacillota bacterium]
MRIVFMGTPEFAVPTLKALLVSRHQVELVVTQPDRPKGRGHKVYPPPVKELALEAGLPVLQPVKLSEVKSELEELAPEAVVVVAFGQKIPNWLLELPKYGCINLHPSLLPKYRGAAPIPAAIRNLEEVTGVTTMLMDEGWDTGDILLQEEVPIKPGETGGELHDRLMVLGASLMVETLEGLEVGTITPVPQDHSQATYAPRLSKEAARIDWRQSAEKIVAGIRAYNPWPVAWTLCGDDPLKIWQGEARAGQSLEAEPGEVVSASKEGILVQATGGQVLITRLQRPGGKPMDAGAFLNGYPLGAGTKLV